MAAASQKAEYLTEWQQKRKEKAPVFDRMAAASQGKGSVSLPHRPRRLLGRQEAVLERGRSRGSVGLRGREQSLRTHRRRPKPFSRQLSSHRRRRRRRRRCRWWWCVVVVVVLTCTSAFASADIPPQTGWLKL